MFFNNDANRANALLPPLPPLPPVFGLDGLDIEIPEILDTVSGAAGWYWFGWGSNNNAAVSKSIAVLQNRNAHLRRENRRLRNLDESWQREIGRLQMQNQNVRLCRREDRQSQIIEELRNQLAELERRDDQRMRTIQGLRREVERLSEKDQIIEGLRIQASELSRGDAIHVQTIQELRNQIAKAGEKDQTIEELLIQVFKAKSENDAHAQTIQELKEKVTQLQNHPSIDKLRLQTTTTLSETILQKDQVIEILHGKINTLSEQHDKQVTELRERIASLSKENDERVNIVSELRVKLTEENEKGLSQERTISSLRDKLARDAETCKVHRLWVERQHQKEMEEAQYKIGEARVQNASLIQRLKSSLKDAERERDAAVQAEQKMNAYLDEVVQRSRALEATNESLEARLIICKRRETETSAENAKQEEVYESDIRALKEELRIAKLAVAQPLSEGK